MKPEIIFHTVWASLAHLSGFLILIRKKGNKTHKLLGRIYAISMLFTLATSFLIYEMWNGFGAFHMFTIIGLVTLGFGMYYPMFARHKKDWEISHYWWMLYSCVGLWLATFSHIGAYLPFTNWITFILVMYIVPYIIAAILIKRFDTKYQSSK